MPDKRDMPEFSEWRPSRATAPASPLLSARSLIGQPVLMPDGFGGMETVGEVREVYMTPDRKRLQGLAIWHGTNVLGGGELLWLPEAAIQSLSTADVHIANRSSLQEWPLSERARVMPHRLEMLRGRPLSGSEDEAGDVDCLMEPSLRCVLSATCRGLPALLIQPARSDN